MTGTTLAALQNKTVFLQLCKGKSIKYSLKKRHYELARNLHNTRQESETVNMKKEISNKGLYIGTGAGMVLFAVSGLLPGSFIGGSIGVSIAANIFGAPLGTSLLPKLIVAISMLLGVLTAGVIFIIGTSSLGWLIGHIIEVARYGGTVENKTVVDRKWNDSVS